MKVWQKFVLNLKNVLLNWYVQKFSAQVHNDINTMPVYNWFQIHSTKDYRFMLKERTDKKLSALKRTALALHWKQTYNQYLKMFGLGEQFAQLMSLKKKLIKLLNKKIQTGDTSLQTFIEIAELEMNQLQNELGSGASFYESKAILETALGFTIDQHRTSVVEFYTYINILKQRKPHGRGK